jgi:hypothetical protein
MKYKTGDQVRVKPRAWFDGLKVEPDGTKIPPQGEALLDYHVDAAGQVRQIASAREEAGGIPLYKLRGHSYFFPEEILDQVKK